MKPMMIVIGVLALSWSSCSTYQYITVASPDISQNSQHQFVAENDTMKLTYDFNGSNGPVHITVFNKLDKPLLIDMNRSALIVNDKAISFYSGKVELMASLNTSTYRSYIPGIVSTSSGTVSATGTLPAGMIFIPSGSYITQSPLVITNQNLENIPDDKFHTERYTADDQSVYKMKTAGFTAASSPLVFRTYLTFVQDDADKKAITWQHSFYVSEVKQSTAGPYNVNFSNAGDQFYVSKVNNGAQVAGTAAVVAVVATAAAVGANNRK